MPKLASSSRSAKMNLCLISTPFFLVRPCNHAPPEGQRPRAARRLIEQGVRHVPEATAKGRKSIHPSAFVKSGARRPRAFPFQPDRFEGPGTGLLMWRVELVPQ